MFLLKWLRKRSVELCSSKTSGMAEAKVVHRAPSAATSSLLICPSAFPGLTQLHIPFAPLGRPARPLS